MTHILAVALVVTPGAALPAWAVAGVFGLAVLGMVWFGVQLRRGKR